MGIKQKAERKKRRTALVICRENKQFWTTQAQFLAVVVRERVVVRFKIILLAALS
jgi:hypothetical protein